MSSANRYWIKGPLGPGCGSPHTPRGYIWPLGLMVEVRACLPVCQTCPATTTASHVIPEACDYGQ
jgi:hypothetical protein